MGGKRKDGAVRLPKRIGGVKLPKPWRSAPAHLLAAAASPAGRELIATGLTLAATALRASARRSRERREPDAAATGAAPHAAGAADPRAIGAELGRVAEMAFNTLFKPVRR